LQYYDQAPEEYSQQYPGPQLSYPLPVHWQLDGQREQQNPLQTRFDEQHSLYRHHHQYHDHAQLLSSPPPPPPPPPPLQQQLRPFAKDTEQLPLAADKHRSSLARGAPLLPTSLFSDLYDQTAPAAGKTQSEDGGSSVGGSASAAVSQGARWLRDIDGDDPVETFAAGQTPARRERTRELKDEARGALEAARRERKAQAKAKKKERKEQAARPPRKWKAPRPRPISRYKMGGMTRQQHKRMSTAVSVVLVPSVGFAYVQNFWPAEVIALLSLSFIAVVTGLIGACTLEEESLEGVGRNIEVEMQPSTRWRSRGRATRSPREVAGGGNATAL